MKTSQRQTELLARELNERRSGFTHSQPSGATPVRLGRVLLWQGLIDGLNVYRVAVLSGIDLAETIEQIDAVRDPISAAKLAVNQVVGVVVSPSPEPSFILPGSGGSVAAAAQYEFTITDGT